MIRILTNMINLLILYPWFLPTMRLSLHRGMGAQHQRPRAHRRPAYTQAMAAVSVITVVVI